MASDDRQDGADDGTGKAPRVRKGARALPSLRGLARLRKKSVLGIEVTPTKINIVELTSTAQPVRIRKALSVDRPAEQALEHWAVAGRNVLTEAGIKAGSAHLVISTPKVEHRLVPLPPMSNTEMRAVLSRELAREHSLSSGDFAFDFIVTKRGHDKEGGKREVLCVAVDRGEIDESLFLVQAMGLRVLSLSTGPLSLLNLLELRQDQWKGRNVAFVLAGETSCQIVIAKDGGWRFSREVAAVETEPDEILSDGELTPLFGEKLITEINRSLLYFKQRYRGAEVERIVIAGKGEKYYSVMESVAETSGIEVEWYPAEETIDVSGLDEALSAGTFVASYGIPAGACLTGAKESTINLLPPEVRQRRRNMAGVASIGAVVVGFWLFIFATMSMLEKSASGYRELLDLRQDQWEEALERTDKIKALEAKRTKLKSKRFVLENLVDVHPMWMGMFRELSLVVPEEVLLTSLKVGRQGPVYEWEMTGTVEAPNHRELKRGFNRFYTSLISSRFFYGLRMEPVKITSDDDGTGSETTQSRMEFHLKGLMRQAVTREDQG